MRVKTGDERHWDYGRAFSESGHAPKDLIVISLSWQRKTGYLAAVGAERCP